ncbi:Uncharacterized protein BM_BM7872 [Brugia malayi]|uniref:Uncharacterized protein n=2 Tax=Brugia malayi TaxID=6279 RepID=A0A4E9FLV0_BRUMA|nr:Uncharacterized protein BM_BM7872 [Brugia malayi]VIO97941.1 Uncharacterized protein BM_BM7872 [Brugia malayi]
MAFFFGSSTDQNHCNRLKVEQCFKTAFQTMRIRRNVDNNQSRSTETSKVRHRCSLRSVTHVMMPRNQHLCAANRHYLSCFNNDACQDDYTAHIASTVFNQIHGRILPIQMFLAHRGYALRLCSQTCSHESRMKCQQMLSIEERQEEQGNYLKLVKIAKKISLSDFVDEINLCHRFKMTLRKLIQYRTRFCGEVAKCICNDMNIQAGVMHCKAGCDSIVEKITTVKSRRNKISSKANAISFNNFITLFILFRLS